MPCHSCVEKLSLNRPITSRLENCGSKLSESISSKAVFAVWTARRAGSMILFRNRVTYTISWTFITSENHGIIPISGHQFYWRSWWRSFCWFCTWILDQLDSRAHQSGVFRPSIRQRQTDVRQEGGLLLQQQFRIIPLGMIYRSLTDHRRRFTREKKEQYFFPYFVDMPNTSTVLI